MSYRVAFRLAALALAACAASTLHAAAPATGASPPAPSVPVATAGGTVVVPAAETFTVGSLKVERFGGAGKAVILIPGLAGGRWVWNDTIGSLTKDHTVYAVTLAGFDGTAAPKGDASWLDQADESLASLVRKKHLEKGIIVGHSLGGTIALRFAGRHPDLTAGVVAVDGLPIFPGMERVTAEQRTAIAAGMRAKIESATPEAFEAQQLGYMQKVGTRDPATAARVAPLNARSDQKAVARYMAEDVTADFRPVLKDATPPILEISPYNAPDFAAGPMTMSEEQKTGYYASLLSSAPNAKVISIGPSRHYVMLDQPVAFQKALADFIQAH
jgi:pimeloyl-ACP methyl ester carboxylesterase